MAQVLEWHKCSGFSWQAVLSWAEMESRSSLVGGLASLLSLPGGALEGAVLQTHKLFQHLFPTGGEKNQGCKLSNHDCLPDVYPQQLINCNCWFPGLHSSLRLSSSDVSFIGFKNDGRRPSCAQLGRRTFLLGRRNGFQSHSPLLRRQNETHTPLSCTQGNGGGCKGPHQVLCHAKLA